MPTLLLLFCLITSAVALPAEDWQAALGPARGVPYDGAWTPPGESHSWNMDCSNTTRWIYRSAVGMNLPRTASDQHLFARQHGHIWRISASDQHALAQRLRPGDLLFWENTYRPVRRPPVTHVMVYVGTDARGRWLMAGSKSRYGVGIYHFDPLAPSGGYRFFFGIFHKSGRFVAVGRVND